jgi:hypothetical protein
MAVGALRFHTRQTSNESNAELIPVDRLNRKFEALTEATPEVENMGPLQVPSLVSISFVTSTDCITGGSPQLDKGDRGQA